MLPAASQPFPPPPQDIAPLLADLRRGDLSFNAIAARHNITPDTLALWINQPTIREQLEATDIVSTYRTRLIAADTLPTAIVALSLLLKQYNRAHTNPDNPHELASDPDDSAASTSDIRHLPSHIPTHEAARRAAATLVRIANLRPTTTLKAHAESIRAPAPSYRAPAVARGSDDHTPAPEVPQRTHNIIQQGFQALANLRASQSADIPAHAITSAPTHPITTPHPPAEQPFEDFANNLPEDFNHQAFQSDLEAFLTSLESNPEAPEHQDPDAALFAILQKHMPTHPQAP